MKSSPTPLTTEQAIDLENWLDERRETWISAIYDPNSAEAKEIERLAQAEAEWLEREDYYHLAYDHL